MYRYGVFAWRKDGVYPARLAVRGILYIRESAAQKEADKLNATGGNYVVREVRL
jgi:hypothetical protein